MNQQENFVVVETQMNAAQRLYNAFWRWQYRTRMSITRPFRIALMRRRMNRRKGGLIIPKREQI